MGKLVEAKVDTSGLERKMARLARGLDPALEIAAREEAARTAAAISAATPVLTGRLRATVGVTTEGRGAAVTYGGGLPYAHYIDGRTHAVEDASRDARPKFTAAAIVAANRVIGNL